MKIISMILENISVWILGQRERRGGGMCSWSRPSQCRILGKLLTSLRPPNPKPKANIHSLLVLPPLRVVVAKEENSDST